MSIQGEIDRIQAGIENTYSVLEGYGATMPSNKNADNLAATAATVIENMQDDAQTAYDKIVSRGEQLVVNGSGLMGDDTNFSAWTYDGAVANNSAGSFTYTSGKKATLQTDEFFPVDPTKKYRFSLDVKSANGLAKMYSFLSFYDADKKEINVKTHVHRAASTTTLAQDLKAGDTVIYLTDSSGWSTSYSYGFYLAIWNYTNSFGYTYPVGTYTRNRLTLPKTSANKLDSACIDFTAHTITLASAYTGSTIPAGTAVSQGGDAATYKYLPLVNTTAPTEWTRYTGHISGVDLTGGNVANMFPPAVAYCKIGFLWNNNTAADQVWITNISVTDVSLLFDSMEYTDTEVNEAVNVATAAEALAQTALDTAEDAQTAADAAKEFVVTVTGDDENGYTADKTYAEILAAYDAGRSVSCVIMLYELPVKTTQMIKTDTTIEFIITIGVTEFLIAVISDGGVGVATGATALHIAINNQIWNGEEAVDFTDTINAMISAKTDTKANATHTHAISDVTNLQTTLDNKLSRSENVVMDDGKTIKLSMYGNRFLTLNGNSITADMSQTTGGWAGTFAGVKDPTGDTTTMLGWYGGTSGLTHIFMGGTYSDPAMKMTKAGQFTFKNAPLVGSVAVSLADHTHTVSHTPAGTVSKPTFTGTAATSGAPSKTGTVYSITDVGSVPTLSASVANRCLTLSFNAGAVPTRSAVTVASSDHTHSVTATGTVSQPTFTGTAATLTTSADS